MHTIADVLPFVGDHAQIVGDPTGRGFERVGTTATADARTLTWIAAHRADKNELAMTTRAAFVLCDESVDVSSGASCFIVVPNPKLVLSRIIEEFFVRSPAPGIHPTAVVDPAAQIDASASIGALSYIGASTIGEGTVIHGHAHVYDGVQIGRNVVIHAGCVIGGDGFGFERQANGMLKKFHHVGRVIIEDDVELQSMTHVDRGTLGDTIIRRGTKIDSCCHIAHNDDIGEDNIIAAHTMFSGSVKLGDRCWVGPASVFRDVLTLGDDVFIGVGTLIAKDVEDGARIMGAPARSVAEYKALLAAFRRLLQPDGVTDARS
jgi:UDP-3-O-[3-hydroxymyristoyl] glucosamine N-acyltransferase